MLHPLRICPLYRGYLFLREFNGINGFSMINNTTYRAVIHLCTSQAEKEHTEIVQVLLEHKAEVNLLSDVRCIVSP